MRNLIVELIYLPLSQVGSRTILLLTWECLILLCKLGYVYFMLGYSAMTCCACGILCVLTIMCLCRRVTHLPDYVHILTSMQEGRAGGLEGVFNDMYVLHNGLVSVFVKPLKQELHQPPTTCNCVWRELRAGHAAKPC